MECFPLESPSFIWYLKDTHSLCHIRKSCEHTGRKRQSSFRWAWHGCEEFSSSVGRGKTRLWRIQSRSPWHHLLPLQVQSTQKAESGKFQFLLRWFPTVLLIFPSCRNSSWVTRINTFTLCCWEGLVDKCLLHKHNKQTLILWEHIQLLHRHVALPVTLELGRQRQDLYGKLTN